MKQKHSSGDVFSGGAKARRSVAIKPLEHLQFADHRHIVPGRRIEIQSALFEQLQHRRGGYRFGRGKHGENAVGRHGRGLTLRPLT
ncbi:hypothetical protein D3C76_858730 [compost metagenome]